MTGTVKKFESGWGFIVPDRSIDGSDKDIFVYWSDLKMEGYKSLQAGQRVEFDIGKGPRGPKAVNVEVI